ncbi:2-oxoisovalerate dehydrogenase subunit alpha, mitochondrial [Glycine soja]|uniref:2-oxoisovalerate dehydrogenase subunit alpha, mitochondrial n=1 Tax=Glycine soja TaxID=3848 RepID=A0A0B2RQE3_GLYSO|nr:2-oxoisovalerate dehydrogenase subunit alpha, mitochondrial [Glycine soja]
MDELSAHPFHIRFQVMVLSRKGKHMESVAFVMAMRPWISIVLFKLPVLTYRVGHHSTSDDSTKYCPTNEIEWWRLTCDSVARFRKWIEKNRWWNDMAELLINNLRQQARYTSLNPLNDDN